MCNEARKKVWQTNPQEEFFINGKIFKKSIKKKKSQIITNHQHNDSSQHSSTSESSSNSTQLISQNQQLQINTPTNINVDDLIHEQPLFSSSNAFNFSYSYLTQTDKFLNNICDDENSPFS